MRVSWQGGAGWKSQACLKPSQCVAETRTARSRLRSFEKELEGLDVYAKAWVSKSVL